MLTIDNKWVVYVGYNGFPIGMAQVERQKLISKGMIASGCVVTVLNRYGTHNPQRIPGLKAIGIEEGVHFLFATGTPYRPDSFVKRNLLKFLGLFYEFKELWSRKRCNQLDVLMITTNSFSSVLYYGLIGKILGVKRVLDTVELMHSFTYVKGFKKIDHYLYDNFSFRFVDKTICISSFLMNYIKKRYPGCLLLKVPAIVDFSKFDRIDAQPKDYILFCGSAVYIEVIKFVISAYELCDIGETKLAIISNGNSNQMKQVHDSVANSKKKDNITVVSNLPYHELIIYYKSSKALLIPLRNTDQDVARFPHKIGEYCAAARPIISTNLGEVRDFFIDKESAFLAEDFQIREFALKVEEVINNPVLAESVAKNSFELGKNNFSHLEIGKSMYQFIFNS